MSQSPPMRKILTCQETDEKILDEAKDVKMVTEGANLTMTGPFTCSNKLTVSSAQDGKRSGTHASSLANFTGVLGQITDFNDFAGDQGASQLEENPIWKHELRLVPTVSQLN